jgi:hypothetical protein
LNGVIPWEFFDGLGECGEKSGVLHDLQDSTGFTGF